MMRCKVLVVEDVFAHAELATSILTHSGFNVSVSYTAEKALALLDDVQKSDPFQIIMIDLKLPGMSGVELMQRVKRLYPEIIVCVVSGGITEEDHIALSEFSPFIFFPKPFADHNSKTLLALLRETTQAFERGKKQNPISDYWKYGLASAFIGGAASMIESSVALFVIAPEKFKLHSGLTLTITTILVLALFNGVKLAAAHLAKSPLPFVVRPPNGNGNAAK